MKKILYIFAAVIAVAAASYLVFIPSVSNLKKENPKKTAMMELREAEGKAKGRKVNIQQAWAPLAAISPYLAKAVVIAEDDKFYEHEGFDFEAMKKAVEKDIQAGKFKAGGSTISQQLAKNLYLSPAKSPLRKVKEAVITWKIERNLSKRRILEIYLNVVEWGDGVFGAEAASRLYFGKSAADLTPMEACRLAVVLPSPRKLNPAGDQPYVASRAEFVYSIMLRRGIIEPDYEEAVSPAEAAMPSDGVQPAPTKEGQGIL
ncbi:MAG: monofunctional biosynthetic peptidoglycan transglycosylase [Deltaproteobacteria bacterium]|nr:monofunctional biosynthetic peptidoglycan transglycosylase [Deltaproteobacteria bacterium]